MSKQEIIFSSTNYFDDHIWDEELVNKIWIDFVSAWEHIQLDEDERDENSVGFIKRVRSTQKTLY